MSAAQGDAGRGQLRLGVDTGGTFTDFVVVDRASGELRTAKVPSDAAAPERALAAGFEGVHDEEGVGHVVVGTTVATNAVLERRGPRVLLITNEGFTDIPFIGRLDKQRLYDLHWRKPKPLVKRRDCFGVDGRIGHRGETITELSASSLEELEEQLRASVNGDEVAVAVSCLFSYLDGEHEERVKTAVERALPDVPVALSHRVSPIWREHERASTTIADAFVKPVVDNYVDGAGKAVTEAIGDRSWSLLASNGGHLSPDEGRDRPAQLLLSGLAGGVIGGAYFANAAGHPSACTLDMGGTSCDIGLVLDGQQRYAQEFELDWGLPVTIPCVDVKTIGAGGGSIAWIDPGGLLRVGPQSAGARPGPIAYGHGGDEVTVTDANLLLGRIDPEYFLGGEMALDLDGARAGLQDLAERLGTSPVEAALSIVRIADENMANTIRLLGVERGIDLRQLALVAFGGAGPLHGRAVAARLGMSTLLIPPHPGLCSAFGAAVADARVDRVRTCHMRSDLAELERVRAVDGALCEDAVAALRRSVEVESPVLERAAQMRYLGQNYELEVDLAQGELDQAAWDALLERFASEHRRQHGFDLPGEIVELTSLRVTARVQEPPLTLATAEPIANEATSRQVVFERPEPQACPVHRRESLRAGEVIDGPLIVEDEDSTSLIHPSDRCTVDASGTLVVELGGAQ